MEILKKNKKVAKKKKETSEYWFVYKCSFKIMEYLSREKCCL